MFDNTTTNSGNCGTVTSILKNFAKEAAMKKVMIFLAIFMIAMPTLFAAQSAECNDNFCFNPSCDNFSILECEDDCDEDDAPEWCSNLDELKATNGAKTEIKTEAKAEAKAEVIPDVDLQPAFKEAIKVYVAGDAKDKLFTIAQVDAAITEQQKRIKEVETEKLSCLQDKKNVESSKVEAGELHGYEEDPNTEAHTEITANVLANLTPMADRCIKTSDAKIEKVEEEIAALEKIKLGITNLKLSSSSSCNDTKRKRLSVSLSLFNRETMLFNPGFSKEWLMSNGVRLELTDNKSKFGGQISLEHSMLFGKVSSSSFLDPKSRHFVVVNFGPHYILSLPKGFEMKFSANFAVAKSLGDYAVAFGGTAEVGVKYHYKHFFVGIDLGGGFTPVPNVFPALDMLSNDGVKDKKASSASIFAGFNVGWSF